MATWQNWHRHPAAVVIAGGLIVLVSTGLRQSYGIFMQPLGCVLGIDREMFGLAIGVQNLVLGLPLAGYLADRFAPRRVVFIGALLYVCALFLMTEVHGTPGLLLILGVLTGLAQSATTYVVVLGAIGRVVDPSRRSTAFGIVTGLGSFGLFLMVPLANHWLVSGGWNWAFEALAWTASIMLFASVFMPDATASHEGASLTLVPLDLRGVAGTRLKFQSWCDTESGFDYGRVEVSTDGNSWSEIWSCNGSATWTAVDLDLSMLDDQSSAHIRFRLTSDSNLTRDGWSIDNLVIEGSGSICGGTPNLMFANGFE